MHLNQPSTPEYRFFKGRNEPDLIPTRICSSAELKLKSSKENKKYVKQSEYFGFDLLHYVMINDQDVDSKDRQNAKQNEKENKSGGNIEFSISASDGQ